MGSINLKFPFAETNSGGIFDSNNTTENALRDDLISLLTTRRGARVSNNSVFSPIYDFLFEPLDNGSLSNLDAEIRRKVKEIIPQIEIKRINFDVRGDENLLNIKIIFTIINFFNVTQSIELNIPLDETDQISPTR